MSTELINILQTSPIYTYENSLQFDSTLAIRYLVFSFDLILLSTLNHAKLPEIPLFSFMLDKFYSEVKLIVQNDFDFFHMRYNTAINLSYPSAYVNSTSVFVDNYFHDEQRSQQITIKYKLQGNEQIFSTKATKMMLNFGYLKIDEKNHFGRFTIQDFQYHILDQSGKIIRSSQNQNQLKKYLRSNSFAQPHLNPQTTQNPSLQNYNQQGGSFPVVYLTQLNNLKYDGSQQYFNQLIQNLQPYNATNTTSKPDHLFICHDMKSGYAEDVKFSNNLLYKRSNSYRFNYLWHTGVFNYFSHKTISIPPRHWRQLCKKYQVKCLGTFIVEGLKVNETYYLTNEFALKLVYLAKQHKFDGYLLNIENQIKNVSRLIEWLAFLRTKIHQEIPGSMISWYDSIDQKGMVDYQNEVNDRNKAYYELTDSFFTNYWWNDEKLKDDIKSAQPNKTIYVGNDIWGRGTFGGGEFFTFKGINEIEKFNKPEQPNLVPALFAPAYTYETGGQNNNAYFKANEDRLYRGVIFEKFDIEKWDGLEGTHLKALSLNHQKKWYTKYFSEALWGYKSQKKLRVNFLFRIKENATSNPSITSVDYKIIVRVRDIGQDKIVQPGTTIQNLNIPLSKTNIIRHVQMLIDGQDITPKSNLEIILATTIDKVFDHESRLIAMYDQELDWVSNVPMTNVKFIQPYNTFFNMGHGQTFYHKGHAIQQSYDYLADYDIPQTLAINHPFKTSIQHHDAYIGGSSLIINEQTIDLFSLQMPSTQYNYPISYEMKIASKGGPIDTVYLSQSSGFSIFLDKTSDNRLDNGWVEETFELSKDSMKKMKKKFFKQLETTLTVSVKSKCLLGQVHLRPKMLDEKQTPNPKIELIISQSFKTQNKDQIYLTIRLNQMALTQQKSHNRRHLIKIGSQYAAFIYLQRQRELYRGHLDQIPIKLQDKKIGIEVIDVDSKLKDEVVLYDEGLELKELKQQPLSHKIRLTNY